MTRGRPFSCLTTASVSDRASDTARTAGTCAPLVSGRPVVMIAAGRMSTVPTADLEQVLAGIGHPQSGDVRSLDSAAGTAQTRPESRVHVNDADEHVGGSGANSLRSGSLRCLSGRPR